MKLTSTIVSNTSQKLDKSNKQNKQVTAEISATVHAWLKDDKATIVFMGWLTDNAKAVKGESDIEKMKRTQSNKNFQNIVNQTPFQRQYFSIEKGKPLTEELRVKKAKTTMVTAGLATQAEYDDKQYHRFIRPLDVTPQTAKQLMAKIKTKFKLTNKQLSAIANTLD